MKLKMPVLITVVVLLFTIVGCEPERPLVEPDASDEAEDSSEDGEDEVDLAGVDLADFELEDGTYEGTADGYHGDIELEVTVESGEVAAIEVLSQSERDDLWEDAWDSVPDAIIEAQATDVDSVSGATFTSEGIVDAVASALEKAL